MLNTLTSLVTLDNAGIYRSGRWLVRGVSMSVQAGEIVTLIGPNGSGKTTTSKMALGILAPDEGRATLRDGARIGYVPQKLSIDWTLPLTVQRLMLLTGSAKQSEIQTAMEQTGVSHLRDAQVRNLSGGEFQRVLLARAIVRKPELLVLDEPVQGVDFNGEIAMYELIREIRDTYDCGIILVSHNLHLVMSATDRVICLNGHVCCSGSPMTVTASDEFKALFGARAASTLAAYEHHHDHTHLPDGRVKYHNGPRNEGSALQDSVAREGTDNARERSSDA